VEKPEITAAQIKRALMGVTDMESGCKFIADYQSIASSKGTINISIEQLIGLKRTVALAEKLIQLKENYFDGAKDYFTKCRTLQAIQVVPSTAISKWLQDKKVEHSGYLYPFQPEYKELSEICEESKKKYSTPTQLEKESREAKKQMFRTVYVLDWAKLGLDELCPEVLTPKQSEFKEKYGEAKYRNALSEWLKTCTKKERAGEQKATEKLATRPSGYNYLIYDDRLNIFLPLFGTDLVQLKDGTTRRDYFISKTVTEEMAVKLTLGYVIGKMISTLRPRLNVTTDGQFTFTGEAQDWWSTLALHFRDRLLGAVNPPCLACGQELVNTERSSKKYCNGTCRKRAYDQKKRAQ
jgi:hypothetical protein